MSPDIIRLAVHDAICANGGVNCVDRTDHARRNINDDEAKQIFNVLKEYL